MLQSSTGCAVAWPAPIPAPTEKRPGRTVNPTLYTPKEFRRRLEGKKSFLTKVLSGKCVLLIGSEDAIRAA